MSLFRGHKGPILDTSFNPFNDQQIVSCSDDGNILLWEIPEDYSFHKYLDANDQIKDIVDPIKVLSGHSRKVGKISFHPCAENVLASSSLDYSVKIWNLETGKDEITLQHKDLVTSFAFNYNGSLLATTSRDKKLRVWDIRSGKIISEGPGHNGAKPSRVTWLGNTDRLVTTGFSRLSDRQVGVWDVNNISNGPIDGFLVIDSSSGVLIPIYDESNSILYLAGKGDGNIRYYEYENDYLHDLSQYGSTEPQRGFAATPKRAVNVKDNEILKSYKTVNDHCIEPLSFIVPRRSELFQSDIYPDCPSNKAALSASEWFSGKDCNGPLLMSMDALYEGTEPDIKEPKPSVSVSEVKEAAQAAKEEEAAKKEKAKSDVKKEEPKKEEPKKEEPKKEEPAPSSPKGVDDALKSSSEVNTLLGKVNDSSDIEEEVVSGIKDDEWEEVKKPDDSSAVKLVEETKDEPSSTATPAPTLKSEPISKTGSNPKVSEVESSPESKTEPEDTSKSAIPEKDDSFIPVVGNKTTSPENVSSATSDDTSDLKATVDKLALLVGSLESQVNRLSQAVTEKDEKLVSLEKKIDDLLNK